MKPKHKCDLFQDPPERRTAVYGILAQKAPIVAVFHRHSRKWWQLLSWNVKRRVVESGAWFRIQLDPSVANLSYDGSLLAYQASKLGSPESLWWDYFAVSKLPWLYALTAWRVDVYLGCRFDRSGALYVEAEQSTGKRYGRGSALWGQGKTLSEPSHGGFPRRLICAPLDRHYSGHPQYGWTFLDHFYERGWSGIPWSILPNIGLKEYDDSVAVEKPQPKGTSILWMASNKKSGETSSRQRLYFIGTSPSQMRLMPSVNWAEWSHDGRLLTSTMDGALQISILKHDKWKILWSHNLRVEKPDPQLAPAWAQSY